MLALTRLARSGARGALRIEHGGEVLWIEVDRVRGHQVRVLIDAPRSFVVARGELIEALGLEEEGEECELNG